MKLIICLALLFVAVACDAACNPNENNQPKCNANNLNKPIRNFWDPTCYWECKSVGAVARIVHCPTSQLFDSIKGKCVLWNKWQWVPPCPSDK